MRYPVKLFRRLTRFRARGAKLNHFVQFQLGLNYNGETEGNFSGHRRGSRLRRILMIDD